MTLQDDDRRLVESLDRLTGMAPAEVDVRELLIQVVGAVETLFGLDGAGVMLADPDQVLRSVLVSDETGSALERGQELASSGPCIDAYIYGQPVACADVQRDDRYPALRDHLEGTAVRAVLGVPVNLGGSPVGVLNLFVQQPHQWTDGQVTGLLAYAEILGRLLGLGLAARRSDELAGQLQRALDSRVMVERAIGYLMASEGLDANAAFHRLRRVARQDRIRVSELASTVLLTGGLP